MSEKIAGAPNNVREIREKEGLFDYELAAMSGIFPERLLAIEGRRVRPRLEEKEALSDCLGLPIRRIFPRHKRRRKSCLRHRFIVPAPRLGP